MSNRRRVRPVGAAQRLPRPGDFLGSLVEEDVDIIHEHTGARLPASRLLAAGMTVEEIVAATYEKTRNVEPQPDPIPEVEIPTEQEPVMEETPPQGVTIIADLNAATETLDRKWGQQGECRYCHKTMGVFGLPRHESTCESNPDRTSTAAEAASHTDDEYGRCPRCEKSMLLTSIEGHLAMNCVIIQYERRHGVTLPDAVTSRPSTTSAPVAVLGAITTDTDDLYAVLEMLAPTGIKPRLIPLVQDWIKATQDLLKALNA